MRGPDTLAFGWRALVGYPTRAWLTLLALAMGVAAVVLLTSLGEGARRYVVDQFTQLGTHLLILLPGRSETTGGPPPLLGSTPRDLTLDDALALRRSRYVTKVAPLSAGSAPVTHGALNREVTILGTTAEFLPVRSLSMAQGRFLPAGDDEESGVVVLGAKLAEELFAQTNPLGARIRVADRRFRVIGVLAQRGQSLGTDLNDVAIIPVASAQALFNSPALFRVLIQASGPDLLDDAKRDLLKVIKARHEGEDDVTIITQDALLSTFDGILRALTYAVAGIGAISLLVAGVLIMNVMLVSVSQRTREIGLLKALGAPQGQVLRLFLAEAALLSGIGSLAGLALSAFGVWLLGRIFPTFPVAPPTWAPIAAVSVALGTGLLFGLLPARRAARLDPVRALAGR